MSDREIVTIDPQQFAALDRRVGEFFIELRAIRDRLGPAEPKYNLHQILSHLERTLHDGLEAGTNGGGNGDAIQQISNKIDQLFVRLENISTEQGMILDLVEQLGTDPAALNDAITKVRALREKLQTSLNNQTQGD